MFSFLSFIQEGCIKLIKSNSQQLLRPENIYTYISWVIQNISMCSILVILRFLFFAPNHIRTVSDQSCASEDWSNN